MSYQALYRKYRPSTLEDVIGQDVIIKILKNAVINDKIGHAYLFSGPRGIGKTSIAKLVAKTVNCLNPKNGSPCEECDNCKAINSGFNADIIEIDAASNNGVDEIREIKNKINLVPSELKYKVYIIDEVHMLSIGAFNALLKTLEEPPEYIIFILATTDPQKVPATIVSRCQCFEFHRISTKDIVERLKYICKNENIGVTDDVLERIAELSDGGLRDSIGMLDKLNAYSNDKITMEDFEKVNGIVSVEDKKKFIDMILNGDITKIIEFIDEIYDLGKDLNIFIQDLLKITKDSIISYYVDNKKEYNIDSLLNLSLVFNKLLGDIKNTSNVKTLLEINIISFINKNCGKPKTIEKEKVEAKEEKVEKVTKTVDKELKEEEKKDEIISQEIISEPTEPEIDNDYNEKVINNCFARASRPNKTEFEKNWSKVSEYALDSKYGAVASFLSDGNIRVVGDGEVLLSFGYESMVNRGLGMLYDIKSLLKKVYDKDYDIALVTNDNWNNIKNKYVEDKNNGKEYVYTQIDIKIEKKKTNTSTGDSIASQAIELFGEDIISVN